MLMDKVRKLFAREEIPRDAKEVVRNAASLGDVLGGLDELITRNEMEVNSINRELEALEAAEAVELDRVRGGKLPERSRNNVLRRIQRLRKQMDNLEERQRIYNRNITLQIHLVGRIQALGAMDLRGVGEDRIDEILAEYEEELGDYQGIIESEAGADPALYTLLDDRSDLAALEASILGVDAAPAAPRAPTATRTPAAVAARAPEREALPRVAAEKNGHSEEAV